MVTREQRSELRAVLQQEFPRERNYLLPALHFLHHRFGYLPTWAMEVVGWHLHVPSSEVYGSATSYTELRTKAPARHILRVCTGMSCWLQGGEDILKKLSTTLKIAPGETTPDGEYALEETPCAFVCAVAPVVEHNNRITGRVALESLPRFLHGGSDEI
jgi:NADH:ubiquinone oxidoreductase subunit E